MQSQTTELSSFDKYRMSQRYAEISYIKSRIWKQKSQSSGWKLVLESIVNLWFHHNTVHQRPGWIALGQKRLSKSSGMSVRTVSTVLSDLRDREFITVRAYGRGGRQTRYSVDLELIKMELSPLIPEECPGSLIPIGAYGPEISMFSRRHEEAEEDIVDDWKAEFGDLVRANVASEWDDRAYESALSMPDTPDYDLIVAGVEHASEETREAERQADTAADDAENGTPADDVAINSSPDKPTSGCVARFNTNHAVSAYVIKSTSIRSNSAPEGGHSREAQDVKLDPIRLRTDQSHDVRWTDDGDEAMTASKIDNYPIQEDDPFGDEWVTWSFMTRRKPIHHLNS